MNAPYRPTDQVALDQQITQAIYHLRHQGQQNFAEDLEQVKQLSATLVSWNDALMHELDQAMSLYAQSRGQLLSKILSAASAASPDAGRPQERAPDQRHHDPSLEPLARRFASSQPPPLPQQPQPAAAPFGRVSSMA